MFLPRCVRLGSVSLCVVLVFHLVSAAVRAEKGAPPAPVFVAVTQAAGIDFHLSCGGAQNRDIMESMCGGGVVIDYDNCGWADIFPVTPSTLPQSKTGNAPRS